MNKKGSRNLTFKRGEKTKTKDVSSNTAYKRLIGSQSQSKKKSTMKSVAGFVGLKVCI